MGINKAPVSIKRTDVFKNREGRHFLVLGLIIISLPFSIKINSILIILLLINSIVGYEFRNIKIDLKKYLPIVLLSTPFFLSAIALTYSDNIDRGLFTLEKSLSFLAFPIAFILAPQLSKCSINSLKILFISILILVALICLGSSIFKIIINESLFDKSKLLDRKYYYFTYLELSDAVNMTPIYLGIYMNFAVALTLQKMLKYKNKLLIFALIFLSIFLLLLSSKINIIIYVFIILISLINFIKFKKFRFVKFMFILLAALAVASILIKPIRERIISIDYFTYNINQGHIGYWNSANLRLAIWKSAIKPIRENWIFGVGTGSEKQALMESYRENNFKIGIITQYNTHNQFLAYCLRFGIFATILVTITNFIIPLWKGYKFNHALFLLLIIIILAATIEEIFSTQKGIVFYSFFTCLFISNLNQKVPDPNHVST